MAAPSPLPKSQLAVEKNLEQFVEELLIGLGFVAVGILSRAEAQLDDWLSEWLANGYHAEMDWMKNHASIRSDPCSIVENGKSIIIAAYPYLTKSPKGWETRHPISNYAWGEDYHRVLKKKLQDAIHQIQQAVPNFQGRAFTDSAPIPEKILAAKAGIGWIGKNSLLINRHYGSYLFLAEIVCNLDLHPTPPGREYCGSCTACINACPTMAIKEDRVVDSRLCLSYLTIEKRGDFSPQEEQALEHQLFGCDLCQQACPWNHKAPLQKDSPFQPFERWNRLKLEQLAQITEEEFEKLKEKSPIKRAKWDGIRRNAAAILANRVNN